MGCSFMKYPNNLEELKSFILDNSSKNENGETENIEYKSLYILNGPDRAVIRRELGESISAFANTSGGYILLGVNDKGELEMPGIDFSKFSFSRLEDIVNSCISPVLKGIEIKSIEGSQKDYGYYVVCIPKGHTAYQSVPQKIYYVRQLSSDIPASDDYVRLLMFQQKHPIFEVKVFKKENVGLSGFYILHFKIQNISSVYSRFFKIEFYIPLTIQLGLHYTSYNYYTWRSRTEGNYIIYSINSDELVPSIVYPFDFLNLEGVRTTKFFPKISFFDHYLPLEVKIYTEYGDTQNFQFPLDKIEEEV